MMDEKNFEYLLDLHGADFSRWGADDAAAAQKFLETSAGARALLTKARALDDLLDAHRPGPMPGMLAARVAHALDRPPAINDNQHRAAAMRMRYAGLALAACAALVMLAQFTDPVRGPVAGGVRVAPVELAPDTALAAAEIDLFVMAMADTQMDDALETLSRKAASSVDEDAVDLFIEDILDEQIENGSIIQ